jgi:hypothetical protein
VVEVTVPLSTLIGLSDEPGELRGWGPVLADVARQTATQEATWRFRVTDDDGRLIAHGSTKRRPTTEAAAYVRARGMSPAGHRAAGCDLDHTIAWTHGGPTHPTNLGALCRYHHRAKHHPGWHLRQPQPGVFTWTSPLGHTYTVGPDQRPDRPSTHPPPCPPSQ